MMNSIYNPGLNRYLTGQIATPSGTGAVYQPSITQLQAREDAIREANKEDAGWFGEKAALSIIEEGIQGAYQFGINEIESVFLDRGVKKLSAQELADRYVGTGFNPQRDMTLRHAEAEFSRFVRRQELSKMNHNFRGNDVLNNIRFTLPTILGQVPMTAAVESAFMVAGAAIAGLGSLGVAGAGLLGASAIAAGAVNAAKVLKYANQIGRASNLLRKSGKFLQGGEELVTAGKFISRASFVHEGILVNGVESIADGVSEYYQGMSGIDALKTVGANFGVGLVATPIMFGLGRLGEAGLEKTGDLIRNNAAIKGLSIARIADSFANRSRTKPKVEIETVSVGDDLITNYTDSGIEIDPNDPRQLEAIADAEVDIEDVVATQQMLDALPDLDDVTIKENAPMIDTAGESIADFVKAVNEDNAKTVDISDLDSVDVISPTDKAELKQAFLEAGTKVSSLKQAKTIALQALDTFDTPDELVNALSLLAEKNKMKKKDGKAKAYKAMMEAVMRNDTEGKFDIQEILSKSNPELLTQFTPKEIFEAAKPQLADMVPEQSAAAVEMQLKLEMPFVDQQINELLNNPRLVDRMQKIQDEVNALTDDEINGFITDMKTQALNDDALNGFIDAQNKKQLIAFMSHLDDESVANKIATYLDCKRLKG